MKSLAVASFFSLAALFGLPVGAQAVAPPSPVMTEPAPPRFQPAPQVQPTEARPEGLALPPQDPQDFADNQAAEAQPLPLWEGDDQAVAGIPAPQPTPQPQYDPNNPVDPNFAYAPPDLGPDNDIAQSYDDGYDPQAYTQFQSDLAPYGSWSNDPTYGNVWSPYSTTVGADFVPYASCGHWIMSEYGWTWVSDWNWGWAPFHYGRWITIAGRGWSWIPGTMWGPAWVSWRSGHGYVGWSPLPPRGTRLFAGNGGRSPWRFTTAAGLGAAHPSFVSSRYLPSLFARTTVVANDRLLTRGQWNVHVNAGPTRGMSATPVHLATVAPRALPHVAIYPHAGVALSARPWANAGGGHPGSTGQGWSGAGPAAHPQGAYGQGAHPQAGFAAHSPGGYVQGAHPQGGNGQGWNGGAAPQRAVGRTPAYGPAAARPDARAPASSWSRPAQSYYGSANAYGRPNSGTSYAPPARPYATPSYGSAQPSYHPPAAAYNRAPAQSYAPAQHSYAPPAAHFGGGSSFGGGSHFGGGGSSSGGGSHFGGGGSTSGGGSHFGGGGGGSHFGGGGGGHRR